MGVPQTLNFLGNPVAGFFEEASEVFYPDGGPVIYPRFFSPDGPFDEDYFVGGEDAYLGWKFLQSKRRMAKSVAAKIFQNDSAFPTELAEWKRCYYQTRNRWLNLLLFYEAGNLVKIAPWAVAEALWCFLRSFGTGFGLFFGTLFAAGWVLTHPFWIYKKRIAIQERRKARDWETLGYLSGRVARDSGRFSRLLNLLSLTYCRLVGLEVLESKG
jgi:hypothetical protein